MVDNLTITDTLTLNAPNQTDWVDIKTVWVTVPDPNQPAPILRISQGIWGMKDFSCMGFLGSISKTIVKFGGTYTNCVPTDIGKMVKDDGQDTSALAGYDNAAKEWYLAGSANVASGSAMTIASGGTGAGNTNENSTTRGGGAIMMGHGYTGPTDVPKIILMDSSVGFDTLYIKKPDGNPGQLDVGNLTIHGDAITITGNQEIHWDTYASSDWTNLGGFWFHNTYNGKSMEFKAIAHDYYGTLYPVMQMLYYDYNNATPVTIFQFDMNGTFEYAGYLVEMDYMDDIAALRAIKTKKHENGMTIYDPDSLKFLQGQEGRYSLNACIGWELSMQRKFLQEIDTLKLQIADLHSQLNTLKEDNPNNTVN